MDADDAIVALEAVASLLKVENEDVSNIYMNECAQDISKSVDYIMAKRESITAIITEEQPNDNQTNPNISIENTINDELYKHNMNEEPGEYKSNENNNNVQSIYLQKHKSLKSICITLQTSEMPTEYAHSCKTLPRYCPQKGQELEKDKRTIQSTDNAFSFCYNIGQLRMEFDGECYIGTATVFSVNPENQRVYAITCAHNIVDYDRKRNEKSFPEKIWFDHRETSANGDSKLLKQYNVDKRWIHPLYNPEINDFYDLAIVSFIDTEEQFLVRVNKYSCMKTVFLSESSYECWMKNNAGNDTSKGGYAIYGYPAQKEKNGKMYGHVVHGNAVKSYSFKQGKSLEYKIHTTAGQSGSAIVRLVLVDSKSDVGNSKVQYQSALQVRVPINVQCKVSIVGIHTTGCSKRNSGEMVDDDFFKWISSSLITEHPKLNLDIFENFEHASINEKYNHN